ncbi:MAG: hypothetical protein U0893_06745 [Chloroflexota bacterium]
MTAGSWFDGSTHLYPLNGSALGPVIGTDLEAQQDDDEALDDWLASMTAPQFEQILNLLMDGLGGARSTLNRLA